MMLIGCLSKAWEIVSIDPSSANKKWLLSVHTRACHGFFGGVLLNPVFRRKTM
jgi:hypothetical protein